MDGLLKIKTTKKEGKYYLHMECSVSAKMSKISIYLHAAAVHYHHDCWLVVTIKDIAAAWEKRYNTGLLI